MLSKNAVYVKSPFVQVIRKEQWAVMWHSLFGYPKIVSTETIDFLEGFLSPKTIGSQYCGEPIEEEWEGVEELVKCHFLIPEGFNDRLFLEKEMQRREQEIIMGTRIDHLELIMTEECNFRCTYCIHFNNLEASARINKKKTMDFSMAKEAVDCYIKILRQHGKHIAEVNFGGGEPLLVWSVVWRVLEYCREEYGSEFEFRFSLNTNASLMTLEIAAALKEYRVEIAASLDGLQKENDRVRLTTSGNGTFSAIIRGLEVLNRINYPVSGFAVTVTEDNFIGIDESVIDWACANGMTEIRIDIDAIGMVAIPVEDIVDKLMRMRRYAAERGIDIPGFWIRPAENLNESVLDGRIMFCGGVSGNSICVTPSGDIYGCGYSVTKLGDLKGIEAFCSAGSVYHRFVRDRMAGAIAMCRGCIIEGQCGGGCQITQEFASATKSAKIERMCDFYRRMTVEILREQLNNAIADSPDATQ